MDKYELAKLVSMVSVWTGRQLDHGEISDLESFYKVPEQKINSSNLQDFMKLMHEGNQKIEAIKAYRTFTGEGLREAKEAVDKYWGGVLSIDSIIGEGNIDSKF